MVLVHMCIYYGLCTVSVKKCEMCDMSVPR